MDKPTQAQVLREQRAGYSALRRHDIEAARAATLDDRVQAFNNVMSLARALDLRIPSRDDDEVASALWARIRQRHVAGDW